MSFDDRPPRPPIAVKGMEDPSHFDKYGKMPDVEFPTDDQYGTKLLATVISAIWNREHEKSIRDKAKADFVAMGFFDNVDTIDRHNYSTCPQMFNLTIVAINDIVKKYCGLEIDKQNSTINYLYNKSKNFIGGKEFFIGGCHQVQFEDNTYIICTYIDDGYLVTEIYYNRDTANVQKLMDELQTYIGKNSIWDSVLEIEGNSHRPLKFLEVKSISDEDVFCPKDVKEVIFDNSMYFLINSERLAKRGITNGRKILLHGDPGNGKSMLIGSIIYKAKEKGLRVLVVAPYPNFDVRSVFEVIDYLSPVLVIWDDIDLVGADRDSGGCSPAAMHDLLNHLDGTVKHNNYVLVASTNRLDVIEHALSQRPGRFDKVIQMPPPSGEHMVSILNKNLGDHQIDIGEVKDAVSKIRGRKLFSGALVKEVAHSAIINSDKNKRDVVCSEDLAFAINNLDYCKEIRSVGFGSGK
jgi:ATP-dependent 26S proteasome regulatory subunit